MRGGVAASPSPGARSEGITRFGTKNWRGNATAPGADEDAHAFGLGRDIFESRLNSNASKPDTSCDVDAVLQSHPSKEKGTAALGGIRGSYEPQNANREANPMISDATDEYPSNSLNDQGVGMGQAILETARELAQASIIPAVSEAAAMISVLVRLVPDRKQSDDGTVNFDGAGLPWRFWAGRKMY